MLHFFIWIVFSSSFIWFNTFQWFLFNQIKQSTIIRITNNTRIDNIWVDEPQTVLQKETKWKESNENTIRFDDQKWGKKINIKNWLKIDQFSQWNNKTHVDIAILSILNFSS